MLYKIPARKETSAVRIAGRSSLRTAITVMAIDATQGLYSWTRQMKKSQNKDFIGKLSLDIAFLEGSSTVNRLYWSLLFQKTLYELMAF